MSSPRCNSVDYRKRFIYKDPSSREDGALGDHKNDPFIKPNLCFIDFTVEQVQNLWTLHDYQQLKANSQSLVVAPALALVYMYGEWDASAAKSSELLKARLEEWLQASVDGLECHAFCGKLRLSQDSVDHLDQVPPSELPALAIISQKQHDASSVIEYLPVKPSQLREVLWDRPEQSSTVDKIVIMISEIVQNAVHRIESDLQLTVSFERAQAAVRIFVAGDRSSVGKSSVCLGILGNLLAMGYKPKDLAYIKPATQSESTQLIQLYCEQKGIACIPIGPLVYYRGFTRAFLAGETPSTDELLASCAAAVDRLARGRHIVVMDGVGFPAVGSICGTDNAAVALACSYPLPNGTRKPAGVLLVGGSGVGAAVDAFNLNAAYFERAHIPVMGAVFNKLSNSSDHFYSLENCREQVTKYFDQHDKQRRPFGFCPLFEKLKENDHPQILDFAAEWIQIFGQYVDVAGILTAAQRIKQNPNIPLDEPLPAFKRLKLDQASPAPKIALSRAQIEQEAIRRGAPVSA